MYFLFDFQFSDERTSCTNLGAVCVRLQMGANRKDALEQASMREGDREKMCVCTSKRLHACAWPEDVVWGLHELGCIYVPG